MCAKMMHKRKSNKEAEEDIYTFHNVQRHVVILRVV